MPRRGTPTVMARSLGVSAATVYNWIYNGLRTEKTKSTVMLDRETLLDWLEHTGRLRLGILFDYTGRVEHLQPETRRFLKSWSNSVPLSASFVSEFLKVLEIELNAQKTSF